MNKYNLNCYSKPFILKDGTKVYPKMPDTVALSVLFPISMIILAGLFTAIIFVALK